jgi:RHS repeat-associated protein
VLLDFAGAVAQLYSFDAYGNAIGFDPATALTEFLYSGEQFDSKIGQQYLRARYYDPATGRFNRLDPFFGNLNDPQSLHKYLYTHADPVNGIDPNGLMSVGGMLGGLSIGNMMAAVKTAAVFAAKRFICGALSGMVIGGTVGGIDSALGQNNSFEDVLIGAKHGAIMGFALGGTIAVLGTFVPTAAITALGVTVGVPLTAFGVYESVQEGNYVQASWRVAGGMIVSRFLYRFSNLFCFAEGTEVISYDPEYYQYLTKQLDIENMEVISNSSTNPIMSHKMALFLSVVYAVYQITKFPTKKTPSTEYNNIKKLFYFYQNLNNIVR